MLQPGEPVGGETSTHDVHLTGFSNDVETRCQGRSSRGVSADTKCRKLGSKATVQPAGDAPRCGTDIDAAHLRVFLIKGQSPAVSSSISITLLRLESEQILRR
jgi:hypothetical protein